MTKSKELDSLINQKLQERVIVDSKKGEILTGEEINRKQQLQNELLQKEESQIQVPKVVVHEERLSKYMSRTGICSRRQAEEMISKGLVFVDGRKVKSNLQVSVKNDIKIFTTKGEKVPLAQDTKVYQFYKPRGLLCTHDDPLKRPTIYDFLRNETKLDVDHIISVGRLDFNSEGLLLLTNNGELASMLENPMSKIMREYRVRVQGKLDEIKLLKIRGGAVIKGVQYGPFEAEIDNRQTTNTWLKIRMYQGKNREIRKVMQKYDLRVNRLKRLKYGCYKVGKMVPGDIFETMVFRDMQRKFYLHLRKKFEHYNSEIREQLMERYGNDIEYVKDHELTEEERLYLANNQYDPQSETYYLNDPNKKQKKTHKQLLLTEPKIVF